ncbi:MAG: RrF2 family transcriptional regulator [Blautia sp.]|nr:RrF2 family transcriptional regulator [Blautia sp.]
MLISTKGRYALRVMLELAGHEKNEVVPLIAIAEKQQISEKYLESILVVLSKAGVIDGLRGKGGGYRLNREPKDYSVGEILRLTEGSLAPVSCLEGGSNHCDRAAECKTLPLWEMLDTLICDYLDSVSLEDLLGPSPLTEIE